MATPIHNPFFQVTIRFPDGRTQKKGGSVTGWLSDMQWLEDTLLHGKPIQAEIISIVATNKSGTVKMQKQPDLFTEYAKLKDERRSAAGKPVLRPHLQALLEQDPKALHPGVQEWVPQPPSEEKFEDQPATMEPVKPIEAGDTFREPAGPQSTGSPQPLK